jgi:hypothetical protein
MWSKLGIASLCLAVIALAYPTLHGIIGLGYSDKLNVFPQSFIEILGVKYFLWINHIPLGFVQRAFLFIFELPLFILFFGISGTFFVIHFLSPKRG